MEERCKCGSGKQLVSCCEPLIKGILKAETAEQLMRSRYVAYTMSAIDYLVKTTHVSQRKFYSPVEMEKWSKENDWKRLEIIAIAVNKVEFKAYYLDSKKKEQVHYEKSTFVLENEIWYYLEGEYE